MKAQKIKDYLGQYGMTVYYSAVSRTWYIHLISGQVRPVSSDTLRALIRLLESGDLRLKVIINRAIRAQMGV